MIWFNGTDDNIDNVYGNSKSQADDGKIQTR